MTGGGQYWIQPSTLVTGPLRPGTWVRGIPIPGVPGNIAPVTGAAGCSNLAALGPPGLLEEYDIGSFTIQYGVSVNGSFTGTPMVQVELAILRNGQVAYAQQQTPDVPILAGASSFNGIFTSDLVNAISLGSSDDLALRLGVACSQAATDGDLVIGAQYDPTSASWAGAESNLSYSIPAPTS